MSQAKRTSTSYTQFETRTAKVAAKRNIPFPSSSLRDAMASKACTSRITELGSYRL